MFRGNCRLCKMIHAISRGEAKSLYLIARGTRNSDTGRFIVYKSVREKYIFLFSSFPIIIYYFYFPCSYFHYIQQQSSSGITCYDLFFNEQTDVKWNEANLLISARILIEPVQYRHLGWNSCGQERGIEKVGARVATAVIFLQPVTVTLRVREW